MDKKQPKFLLFLLCIPVSHVSSEYISTEPQIKELFTQVYLSRSAKALFEPGIHMCIG